MIVVFVVFASGLWIKQVVTGKKFEELMSEQTL